MVCISSFRPGEAMGWRLAPWPLSQWAARMRDSDAWHRRLEKCEARCRCSRTGLLRKSSNWWWFYCSAGLRWKATGLAIQSTMVVRRKTRPLWYPMTLRMFFVCPWYHSSIPKEDNCL